MSLGIIIKNLQENNKFDIFPLEILGFQRSIDYSETNTGIEILTYKNSSKFAKLVFFYNSATKDYMLKEYIGLTEFCNMKFINPVLDVWLETISANLESIMQRYYLANTNPILAEKGIINFPFQLKPQFETFKLIITPQNPFTYLNGSSIIIDYTDFASNKQFLVYYNEFRDDFFAEYRVNNILFPCNKFDCRTLEDLSLLLTNFLPKILTEI